YRSGVVATILRRRYLRRRGRATHSTIRRTRELLLRQLHRAPQIPARDRAVRLPPRPATLDVPGRRQLALLEGDREALADAVVVRGQHVRAAEAEDEEHLHRPPANAAHLAEAFDDRLVLHATDLGERGDLATPCPSRKVAQREELRAREAGGTELLVGDAQHLLRRGALVRAREERAHAREDRRGGLGGQLLVDDRLRKHGEDARRLLELHAEGAD